MGVEIERGPFLEERPTAELALPRRLGGALRDLACSVPACQEAGPWKPEVLAFSVFSGLMAENHPYKLDPAQRKSLFRIIAYSLYVNRILDPLVSRARGREGLIFLEEYYHHPRRLAGLKKKGLESGLKSAALKTVDRWFVLNRIINHSLAGLREDRCGWDDYQQQMEAKPDPHEQEIFSQIRQNCETPPGSEDEVVQAIWSRAFSSVGFAQMLVCLTKNCCLAEVAPAKLKRVAAMVMAAQVIDDFCTPSKDVQSGIMAMISAAFKNPDIKLGGHLEINSEDTRLAVSLAREIMAAAVDFLEIDARPWKQSLAKYGLLLGSAALFPLMSGKYEGSRYSIPSLVLKVVKELKKPEAAGEKYYQATQRALNSALSALS